LYRWTALEANALHVLEQKLLTASIIRLSRSAVGVAKELFQLVVDGELLLFAAFLFKAE
jgi:hypothetical protein